MKLPSVLFTLTLLAFQQASTSSTDQASQEQRASLSRERDRQAAIEINVLAGRIHSENDATALVDNIADCFADTLPPTWVTGDIRRRLAHAEFQVVSDPLRLIPEQRIVDVWNQYVREIGASDEALVTVVELHNMRDAEFATSQSLWSREVAQSIWTVPNIYAIGSDGKVAEGLRPVEALRAFHDLDMLFDNLRGARERVRKGILVSDEIRKLQENPPPKNKTVARLEVHVDTNPVRAAEYRYMQEHGPYILGAVVEKLFDELFPPAH
jgi:hypothetical protein